MCHLSASADDIEMRMQEIANQKKYFATRCQSKEITSYEVLSLSLSDSVIASVSSQLLMASSRTFPSFFDT